MGVLGDYINYLGSKGTRNPISFGIGAGIASGNAAPGGILDRWLKQQKAQSTPVTPPVAGTPGATPAGVPGTGGSFATEQIKGNSLEKYMRSLTNYAGTTGADVIGTGMGTYGAGIENLEGGIGTIDTGVEMLNQVADYYASILGGDRASIMAALGPEIQRIVAGYQQQQQSGRMFAPSGGGRAAMLSAAPYGQARDISNLIATARPGAAQGLGATGTAIGGLGAARGQLGGMEAGLGLGAGGLGANLMQLALQNLIARRGQDKEYGFWSNFKQKAGQGLGELIGDISGFGFGKAVGL